MKNTKLDWTELVTVCENHIHEVLLHCEPLTRSQSFLMLSNMDVTYHITSRVTWRLVTRYKLTHEADFMKIKDYCVVIDK